MNNWRLYDVTVPKKVVPGRSPFITPNPNPQEWSYAGKEEEDDIALLNEYARAGAAKNMLPLCWGVDGITTRKPHLCRRTARRGKVYCKRHASLED